MLLQILLSNTGMIIAWSITGMLLGIIGYFLNRILQHQDRMWNKIEDVFTKVEVIEERQKMSSAQCRERHDEINRRLHKHGQEIDALK